MSNICKHPAKRAILAVLSMGLIGIAGAAFGHGPRHNPTRHHYVMKKGIPAGYNQALNPLRMDVANLTAGRTLYNENCALCHAPNGDGVGEAAKDLKPPPAKLAGMYGRVMAGMGKQGPGAHLMHGEIHHHPGMTHAEAMGGVNLDAYSFWAVSEGGESMGSAMPAFKEILTEEQRWQVLLYIANGFRVKMEK